ncbi:hypothetical protein GDO78_020715 [Eleutherodactylus coqui]|uniref:Uncharacterized protein n=1 Tax=Eleutherodactylus coqui TaxID=57060 RepID=A0A8J6B4K7_ELECQ|nr:hypothetical protein GDO78_020715 [Eleutherodactylus coqui]
MAIFRDLGCGIFGASTVLPFVQTRRRCIHRQTKKGEERSDQKPRDTASPAEPVQTTGSRPQTGSVAAPASACLIPAPPHGLVVITPPALSALRKIPAASSQAAHCGGEACDWR